MYQYEMPVPRGSAITQDCIPSLCALYCIYTESGPHRRHRQYESSARCSQKFRDKPSAQNLVLASGTIRSGMKSILNFRHKIEKYGFKCLEFGKCCQAPRPRESCRLHASCSVPGEIWTSLLTGTRC